MCKRLDELNKSRSLHLNQIAIWTSFCKYYAAKVDLNMNPACSAHLCMNGAEARFPFMGTRTASPRGRYGERPQRDSV